MKIIEVSTVVPTTLEEAWDYWNAPKHIVNWYFASEDWHTPTASNNVEVEGTFDYRMEAKDGSFGFNFIGTYDDVKKHSFVKATLGDGRSLEVTFKDLGNGIKVVERFELEQENSEELQRSGWQSILNQYTKYVTNK